jgi:hypothetical protein
MANVVADMSMSLDGFVAGSDDEVDQVFSWMMGGDVALESENPDLGYEVDEASAEELQGSNVKALVIGRRTFDLAGGWAGHIRSGFRSGSRRTTHRTGGTTPRSPSSPKASRRRSSRRGSTRATASSGWPAPASSSSA